LTLVTAGMDGVTALFTVPAMAYKRE